ncbi:hypothetical protein DPMN_168498 [Dreissena polymorpha]|uniref:Uncharacterized protein n=1 Tax=Dreissena polymorpha TaxID=45954 RepID=A0A9D4F588_DREPO|nr:hypothetical protein DPMN_168498 [Dreissena polymorpha]
MKAQLVNRGYDGYVVETELIKVDNKKREDILHEKKNSERNTRIPLVITIFARITEHRPYHPQTPTHAAHV